MVSADNLNFDVLEIIFSFLSVPDLAAVSQVSRSFLVGVIPRLYRSLGFYQSQAKRYPRIMSPFAAVLAHPGLATHVRTVDIRVIPNLRIKLKTQPDPRFLRDCTSALTASSNLRSFTCTTASVLPNLLPPLQMKERLHTLRINAYLTAEQTAKLVQLRGLRNLTLENASWNVIDALPKWAEAIKATLLHLTIHSSHDLNETVLHQTVAQLPKLRGLHIIGCQHIGHYDVLTATDRTPLLESLAFTVNETSRELPSATLSNLKHLALDLPVSALSPSSPLLSSAPSLLPSIMALTRFTHLTSLALRLSTRHSFPDEVLDEMLDMHGSTLRSLRLMGCAVSMQGVENIADACENLERLVMSIPVSDIYLFAASLSASDSIQTLVDVHDHGTHGPRLSLTTEPVRTLMEEVPSLTRVVSDSRCWTGRVVNYETELKLEHIRSRGAGIWFVSPPEAQTSSAPEGPGYPC